MVLDNIVVKAILDNISTKDIIFYYILTPRLLENFGGYALARMKTKTVFKLTGELRSARSRLQNLATHLTTL